MRRLRLREGRGGVGGVAGHLALLLIEGVKMRILLKNPAAARKVVSGQLIWAGITKNTILSEL